MIASILDNDLYKFTMQQAVLELYPEAAATYEFINRRPADRFDRRFFSALIEAIDQLPRLRLRPAQREFLQRRCPALKPAYLEYLQDYRFDPSQLDARLDAQGRLSIVVAGAWHRAILWEVPLLAIVSELHGRLLDVGWNSRGQAKRLREKSETLLRGGCRFADFGTRRRRDFQAQDRAVRILRGNPGFLGTSNVHLARRYDAPAVGTMGHEWIMAHGALCGLKHANRFALEAWAGVYPEKPGTALTDTYTTAAFFADFDARLARLYDSLRQDSGSPFDFVDRAIEHYRKLGVDPASKTIVFSDGLTPDSAAKIRRHCGGRIGAAFGIGTNLTNDFPGAEPLNIVIKLTALDGRPAVKLTDDPAKASGCADALRAARETFLAAPSD